MNSIPTGDGTSGRAAGVFARRGASGGSAQSKGGAGVAALLACCIGTVGTASMERSGAPSDGKALRDGRGFCVVRDGCGTVSGVGPERSKP